MESKVAFPTFIQALKDMGAQVHGAAFLSDAPAAWGALEPEVRRGYLATLGIQDGPEVTIRIGKKPDAPKTVQNILVIFTGPELPGGPAGAAPAEPEPAVTVPVQEPAAPDAKGRKDKKAKGKKAEPPSADAAPPQEDTPLLPAAKEAEKKGGLKSLFRLGKRPETSAPQAAGVVTDTNVPLEEGVVVKDLYPVQEPYAYVRITYNESTHEHRYEVIEPPLSDREANILAFIESTIVDVIEVGLSAMTKEQAAEMLRKHADEVIYDYSIVLSPTSREKILYYILRDFLGFGKLDPVMRDELIEDVSCDGPDVPIFLYHRKFESLKSTVVYETAEELDSYVIKMAQRSGKHVSIADPLLDATLPDGSRLNATLSDEVTANGSTFTIRKFKEDPFTAPDLVRFGTMNEDLLAYWWLAVQNGASAIYAGGTASGKTTSLNAILLFIPSQMKIVSIEDTREVNIPHQNWIAGVTRAGFGPRDNNGRQAGEIDMFTLLKAALRQRPEYILVGEVRGQEATALFQAMATGHTAYGTMHADSTEAVIHRLESEPISIPRSLLEALDIVSIQIQTRIGDRRVRRTKELVEIVGLDPHTREILTNQVFTWNPATDEFEFSGVSYVLERIQMERNMTESDMREEFDRRKRVIRWLVDKKIRALDEVGRIIATYYRNPDVIMRLVDADADGEQLKQVLSGTPAPAAAQAPGALVVQEQAQALREADAAEAQNGAQ